VVWAFFTRYLLRLTLASLSVSSLIQVTLVWGIVPPELLKQPAAVIEQGLHAWEDTPGSSGDRLSILGYGLPPP